MTDLVFGIILGCAVALAIVLPLHLSGVVSFLVGVACGSLGVLLVSAVRP